MRITRFNINRKNKEHKVPIEFQIKKVEFDHLIFLNKNIEWLSEYEFYLICGNTKILKLKYLNGEIYFNIINNTSYIHSYILSELIKLANCLKAKLYFFNNLFSLYKIREFKKKFKTNIYFNPIDNPNNVFFEQGDWLAVNSDINSVIDFFNLELIEVQWTDYSSMRECYQKYPKFKSLIHHYNGWTFIRDNILEFLDTEYDKNTALKLHSARKWAHYIKVCIENKLASISRVFPEIHYYEFFTKYGFSTTFIKYKNGKLIYGYCCESEVSLKKSFCKKPKEIKFLLTMDARYAASVWSIYPEKLINYPDFPETKVWVAKRKGLL